MSVSGRSSSCSIIQEEGIARRMCKTPKTPMKTLYQVTPRKSERKRALFQSNSPTKSDDLGLMSPLSLSSSSSNQSLNSPQFSPNGNLLTPQKTPVKGGTVSPSPRHTLRKIEVKSSLFPDLKVFTPRTRRTPRTPKTLTAKVSTPESQTINDRKILSTPKRKLRRRELFNECVVSESDSSPHACSQENSEEDNTDHEVSDCPTILGIKPLSCESFYGPSPIPVKPRTKLFIDTLKCGSGAKILSRSLSKESLSSNKSFVSGGTRKITDNGSRKKRHSNPSNHARRKSGGRIKGLQPGVWHNIKKPKQIKKLQKEKPLISPKSRLAKMMKPATDRHIKVKEKSLFQENPRKRIAHSRKRERNDFDDDDDDFFDQHLKRRKTLPSQYNVHPAVTSVQTLAPDPNKKFMKYGQTRKATFTLSDNVKLNISDGVMKLQTPKKRRKLYSGKKDSIEDFYDLEDGDSAIQNSIQGILNILEDDKVITKPQPQPCDLQKLSPPKSADKPGRSPLKTLSNLPMLIINDFDSDDEKEEVEKPAIVEKRTSGVTLEKTGNMISYMTNILVNGDQELNETLNNESEENNSENSPPNKDKLYSLFYKQNWNKVSNTNENSGSSNNNNRTASGKKNVIVPDDQYLLDAGQESVGIITCKKCGVMYQAGDFVDEAIHNNFHNHLSELKFTGWNNERVVGKYADGRVIMILNSDPKVWWQKVSKIVDIVDQELGFPEASVQSLFYKTVYLYINEKSKQIAGCLIAEECKVAYKMFPPLEGVEIDSCSKDPSPCRVGISRIWTSLSHRRKGVASRLVECLQKTFFFGDIVPLDQIAFSVPSPSGKLFAQKVTGQMDFLVYGFA